MIEFRFLEQTAVALGTEIDNELPPNEYIEYFGPDYTLHAPTCNMENKNSCESLNKIREKILDNLSKLQHATSVQFQERPPDTELLQVHNCNCFLKVL